MPLTSFIENVEKSEMENIFAVVAAVLVLFVTTMARYISVGMAVTLLVAPGVYEFVKRRRQETGM
jgi:hypothetical protein